MNLRKMIRAYRLHYGVSVRVMAKVIGVEYTVLNRYERGYMCNSDTLSKIIRWALSPQKVVQR